MKLTAAFIAVAAGLATIAYAAIDDTPLPDLPPLPVIEPEEDADVPLPLAFMTPVKMVIRKNMIVVVPTVTDRVYAHVPNGDAGVNGAAEKIGIMPAEKIVLFKGNAQVMEVDGGFKFRGKQQDQIKIKLNFKPKVEQPE